MARKFINMDMDNTNYGYWWVDFINDQGILERQTFDTEWDAQEFYNEIILERSTTQSQ